MARFVAASSVAAACGTSSPTPLSTEVQVAVGGRSPLSSSGFDAGRVGRLAKYLVLPGCGQGELEWSGVVGAAESSVFFLSSDSYCGRHREGRDVPHDLLEVLRRAWEEGALAPSVIAIGHSWGGLLLQWIVPRNPERFTQVVLLDATARGFLVTNGEDRAALVHDGWIVDELVRELDGGLARWPPRLRTRAFFHDPVRAVTLGVESVEDQHVWDADRERLAHLSPFTTVTVVVGATHDLPREMGTTLVALLRSGP